MTWLSFPFFRFLILLSAGILAAESYQNVPVGIIILCVFTVILAVFLFRWRSLSWALLFLLGYALHVIHSGVYNRMLPDTGIITILEKQKIASSYIRYSGRLTAGYAGRWYSDKRKLRVYVRDSVLLAPGTRLLFTAPITKPENPVNPYAFDYARFLRNRKIAGQVFLDTGDYLVTGKEESIDIVRHILRQKIMSALHAWLPDPAHATLLTAMVLGIKDELDAETRHIYSATGSMHVLAVSGLHVGLLFMLLSALFSLLPGRAPWPLIRWIMYLLCLTVYAGLADFTPSVMRAEVFVLLYLLGRILQRRGPLPHVLFMTAFFMLFYNPFQLFDLSFQLSFVAVLGIMLIMPVLSRIFSHHWKIADYFLKNIAVSFAAQLTTLPLTITYFNQVSFTFWLSAMVVIPAAFVLMVLVILLFSLSEFPIIHQILLHLTSAILTGTNGYLAFLASIPGGYIEHFRLPFSSLAIIPLLWIMLQRLLEAKTRTLFYGCIALVFIFIFSLRQFHHTRRLENRVALFYDGSQCVIGRIHHGKGVLAGDMQNHGWLVRNVTPWFVHYGISVADTIHDNVILPAQALAKIDGVNMVFSLKTDNFPKDRVVIHQGVYADTVFLEPGQESFYETKIIHE